MSERNQISFMPWAGLNKAVTLGPVTFWPYRSEAESRIADPDLRSYLGKYFESYVDNKGQPVDTITVCSYGVINFLELNDKEFNELRNCSDALLFSIIAPQTKNAVCANNNSFGPPSSDAFVLITQNFQMNNDYVNVRAGSLLSAGWRIGEVTFPRPWSMGGCFFGAPDRDLVMGFGKCFSLGYPQDIKERLFRSLEWFRLAHTESEQISEHSKIVMMATGYEILLKFPMNGKRRFFTDYVKDNISSDEFTRGTRIDHKNKRFDMSLVSCWAWDFYELRSKIVHGDSVPVGDFIYRDWITHQIVSDLVFLEFTKRELFRNMCIGEDVYSCAKTITKSSEEHEKKAVIESLVRQRFGFNDVHRALGWLLEADLD